MIEIYSEYPRTRAKAQETGAARYYTGIPCVAGHTGLRDTKRSYCLECHNARHRNWYSGNKDRVKVSSKEYREKDPDGLRNRKRKTVLARFDRDPVKVWAMHAATQIRDRSNKKNIPCSVVWQDLVAIHSVFCPIFGVELVYWNKSKKCGDSASIDRIVPELGYVPGNIVVISDRANSIKNNASAEELYRIADWLRPLEESCRTELLGKSDSV